LHLIKQPYSNFGVTVPIFSERGDNVDLANSNLILKIPAGCFCAIPMKNGIGLAGTTEFAFQNKECAIKRFHVPEKWGGELVGRKVTKCFEWMGVCHSSPDSLAVISPIAHRKRIIVLDGYVLGHL
jgi:hypothetical protein